MAGFSAHLTWYHALMLLALGGAIFLVWQEAPEEPESSTEALPPPNIAGALMLVAIVLAVCGSYFAVAGTIGSGLNARMMPPGTVAATVLSALLVLPTLGTASLVAQRGHPGRAITALVGAVLLNLCLLLPIVILLWYPLSTTPFSFANLRELKFAWNGSAHSLPYDIVAWRIETVIVVVLGLALIPVSMGRLMIGRFESALLVIGYTIYVLATAVLGMKLM
jgi:Ca2+/Na+ antiporter